MAKRRHAVAAAVDERHRHAGGEDLEVVVRLLFGELVEADVVLDHGIEAAVVQAREFTELVLERRRRDADALQVLIGSGAGDDADALALQIIVALDAERVALGDDQRRAVPECGTGERDDLVALSGCGAVGTDDADALGKQGRDERLERQELVFSRS